MSFSFILLFSNVICVRDKAVNAEEQASLCYEEPVYESKQDTHREREREAQEKRYIPNATVTK